MKIGIGLGVTQPQNGGGGEPPVPSDVTADSTTITSDSNTHTADGSAP